MNIEITSAIFIGFLVIIGGILILFQHKDDDFDLRDIICSWDGKTRAISTSKSLLAGAFFVSSFYIIRNPTEIGYAAYLAAWVTNGGIAAWQRVQTTK